MTAIPCWLCGDVLHRVADTAADEWAWEDQDSKRFGTDSDLRHVRPSPPGLAAGFPDCPDGRLAELAALMDSAHKHAKRKGVDLTWVYWACAREYSGLKVRLEAGTFHQHQVRSSDLPSRDGPPPPECCGWPMRLRPSGWHCRQRCGRHLAEAVSHAG